jgi:hypothetical protein
METVTQYADNKTELEERIRSMENERGILLTDIASLKERLAVLELERCSESLESEVEALRTEKAILEEKIATYTTEDTPDITPIPSEGYQA